MQILIILISIRLLTTFLTPYEVGNYYIILALLAFFNLVLLNPLGMYFSRHILQWQKSKNLFNALVVFLGWIIFVSIISVPISTTIYYLFGYESRFSLSLFLLYISSAILISTMHRNMMGGTNILGYRKRFVVYVITTLIIGLILSVGITYFYNKVALGWLLGIVLSEALMLYIIFIFFIQKNKLEFSNIRKALTQQRIKKILTFSLPIGLTTFLMWGQTIGYRFIIDYQYTTEILGFIAIGLGVSAAVFSAIESISMQYFNPIFLKNLLDSSKEQRASAWNAISKQIVPIYIIAAFFTITMSEVLINILVDKKFHDSYIYTMFGVGIEFFRVMTNLLNMVSQSEYKTTVTIKPYLVGFIVSLGLLCSIDFGINYFMIPLVLGMAYFLVFIYMYINMRKLLDIRYDIKLFKTIVLSLPFLIIYFINIGSFNIFLNILCISVFGLYFLFVIWLLYTQNLKGNN